MDARELEVLEANEAFYRAFDAQDARAMERLWAERHPIACIHPGWDALAGREEVVDSWRRIFASGGAPTISVSRAEAHVLGDAAFVTCHEDFEGGRLIATNVFVVEGGAWRMVHHHAGGIAPGRARAEPSAGPRN